MASNTSPQSVHFCTTDLKVEEILFQWCIKGMFTLPYQNGKCFESAQFFSCKNPLIKWKLQVYPNGKNNGSKGYISIFLNTLSKSTKVPASVSFSFWNSKTNHCFKERTSKCEEFDGFNSRGYSKFCTHQDFLESTIVGQEMHDIVLLCKIITHAKLGPANTVSMPSYLMVEREKEYVNSLALADYNNLLNSEKFADFTLISSDGVGFAAHKNILSARSPVFSAMLENPNTIEVQQNGVVIKDMDSKTLKELLQYIYAEKCDNLDTMAIELLVAADKYQLNSLKAAAAEVLSRNMSLESILDICVTAHLNNAPALKKHALDFMKGNSKEIVKLCDWGCFVKEYPSLVTELVSI